jgi:hypothetical protein
MADAIYTRADGTPIPRPDPADYLDVVDYLRAFHAWRDTIADIASRAFDERFRQRLSDYGAP